MRVSLCFLVDRENARVWRASGRAARLADRTAVRMRKGVSLLAMAAVMSGNGSFNRVRRRNSWPQLSVVDFEASPIGVLNARTTGSVTIDGG
jgi:hypothetical protein